MTQTLLPGNKRKKMAISLKKKFALTYLILKVVFSPHAAGKFRVFCSLV